jgi:hypothetical protein
MTVEVASCGIWVRRTTIGLGLIQAISRNGPGIIPILDLKARRVLK